jgi:L-threonylcarbamoyladenylate synthase
VPKVSQTQLIQGAIAGSVVSFPTDTVPALAVLPERSVQIFTAKKRSLEKPLILMGACERDLMPYVTGSSQEIAIWQQAIAQYFPGALTLVLPASKLVPTAMNPQDPTTIGIRVPDSEIARAILAKTKPLATTSANITGEPPLETSNAIAMAFPEILTLDLGEESDRQLGSSLPSTVAKWTADGWKILRQGSVSMFEGTG